jgi:hypothetical protein
MRLPQSLWTAVQHRAVDENSSIAAVVERALRAAAGLPDFTRSVTLPPRSSTKKLEI